MNHLSPTHPNPVKSLSSPETEPSPISLTVTVTIADARKSTRVFEAAREQFFHSNPEALAALPSQLNTLVRAAGTDAQVELNRFLKRLAEPEPPVEAPPASPSPATGSPSPVDAAAPASPTPVQAEDYLLPLDLSLLGTQL